MQNDDGGPRKVMVTGAAGFIGSHLVDALLAEGYEVLGVDNLSAGILDHLDAAMENPLFSLEKVDMVSDDLGSLLQGVEEIYHLAANPDVRSGVLDTRSHFDQNILATYRLLEACRDSQVRKVVFSSTSAVYGETESIPTPETEPLRPISIYGASKAACEALVSAYCHQFEMAGVVFRFANVVGSRSTHNVLHDFIRKLRDNPRELEILGAEPGTCKSYIHIQDCIRAIIQGAGSVSEGITAFNIGTEDWTFVQDIATIVVEEMGLQEVDFRWTGGVKGGGGWIGDVRKMLLSTQLIRSKGWAPSLNSHQSIRLAVQEILGKKR